MEIKPADMIFSAIKKYKVKGPQTITQLWEEINPNKSKIVPLAEDLAAIKKTVKNNFINQVKKIKDENRSDFVLSKLEYLYSDKNSTILNTALRLKYSEGPYAGIHFLNLAEVGNKKNEKMLINMLKMSSPEGSCIFGDTLSDIARRVDANPNIKNIVEKIIEIRKADGTYPKMLASYAGYLPDLIKHYPEHLSDVEKILEITKENDKFKPDIIDKLLGIYKKGYYKSDRDQMKLYNTLTSLKDTLTKEELKGLKDIGFDIEDNLAELDKKYRHVITPTPISSSEKGIFFKNILSHDSRIENIIRTASFDDFVKTGLPLKYQRETFLSDFNSLTKDLNPSEKKDLFKKLEIEPSLDNNGNLTSYDGILTSEHLSQQNPLHANLSRIINKFTKENEIVTQDAALNEVLNSLLKGFPEYANMIGKSSSHNQTLDIHVLKVLQEVLNHPDYARLSDESKTVIKMFTLLHDIAKKGTQSDISHVGLSALYTRNLLEKFNLQPEVKARIYELVKNHHWLEQYNKGELTSEDVAAMFRRPEDYPIAKIFADADLKGGLKGSFEQFGGSLTSEKDESIKNILKNMFNTGNPVFADRIIDSSKIPEVSYNGQKYKVLNLTELSDSQDMGEFGYSLGTKKEDLRLITHFLPYTDLAGDLGLTKKLVEDPKGKLFCTSLLSPKMKATFENRRHGFVFNVENSNISTAFYKNRGLGKKYDLTFNRFVELLNKQEKEYRIFFRDNIIGALKEKYGELSPDEYGKINEKLFTKKYYKHMNDIKIGDKLIKGEDLKNAIKEAQDKLLINPDKENNELTVFNPIISSLICKENSIDKVPQEMLDFSQHNNLPIILIGE